MEKYFLGSLAEDEPAKCKLIEVNYKRKPPSFGSLSLCFAANTQPLSDRSFSKRNRYPTSVCLKVLELPPDRGEANFKTVKRVELKKELKIVDLDVTEAIYLNEDEQAAAAASEERKQLECILLDDEGNLHCLKLNDGSIKLLSGIDGQIKRSAGRPLQCKLLVTEQDAAIVHVLHEKSQLSYGLNKDDTLGLISDYSLAHQSSARSLKFVHLLTNSSSPNLVVAQLNDKTLLVLNKSVCLTELKQEQQDSEVLQQQQQLLLGAAGSDELLLVSSSGSRITAHSIMISASDKQTTSEDPDGLLPRVPSFELEKCWSYDLADIGQLRFLFEAEEDQSATSGGLSMCQIQSLKQNGWPKYLLITFRFHLILLSFEQEPVQPFSVIYDRNFLKVTPMTVVSGTTSESQREHQQPQQQQEEPQEYIDAKLKPKLVHNLKLIGSKPSDSLFNTLFLVKQRSTVVTRSSKVNCIQHLRHLPQMNLVVAMLNSGEVFAFKLLVQTESLYQKLVGDSLRSSSALLRSQIDWLEGVNKGLTSRAIKLEQDKTAEPANSHGVVRVELTPDDHTAQLYTLSLLTVCAELVQEILVVSSVCKSQIILPPDESSLHGVASSQLVSPSAINLKLDLEQSNQVDLQLFIPNYSTGCINVFASISTPGDNDDCDNDDDVDDDDHGQSLVHSQHLFEPTTAQADISRGQYHLESLPIRPLQFYLNSSGSSPASGAQAQKVASQFFEMKGDLDAGNLSSWLSECFSNDLEFCLSQHELRLESPLTLQFIEFALTTNKTLKVTSNDTIALDLIRRTIMRRATEASLRLEMSGSSLESPQAAAAAAAAIERPPFVLPVGKKRRDEEETSANFKDANLLETIMSECQQQFDWNPDSDRWLEMELLKEIQLAMANERR